MFTCESVPSVCLRDNNGSHKETWEGSTGRRAGIVIHSLISPLSACCLFSLSHLLYLLIYFLSVPYKKTPVSARARHQISASLLKMQIASICGLLLSPGERVVGSLFGVRLSERVHAAIRLPRAETRLWRSRLPLRPRQTAPSELCLHVQFVRIDSTRGVLS